jgi:2-oxoglutarate dehydrogenase E1 component
MSADLDLSRFFGPNAGYVLELFERYQRDPSSVDAATRARFADWRPSEVEPSAPEAVTSRVDQSLAARVAELAEAVRARGHRAALLDPLSRDRPSDPALDPSTRGLSLADLESMPAGVVGGPCAARARNAREAIDSLREIYFSTTGYEFSQVADPAARRWLDEAVEAQRYGLQPDPERDVALLERLTQVEAFERFLNRAYPGKTRFSIEGNDLLIPMLDQSLAESADAGICEVVVGMAHRGRLNVLAHVLGKPYSAIIAEFEGGGSADGVPPPADDEHADWYGDVKYHLGGQRAVGEEQQYVKILVKMPPNPSHLEFVNPVVEGMARAADDDRSRPGAPVFYENAALPILIHGDAAFPGQGIVAETLGLSRLHGYRTGGTLHVVANNQVGFTTEPEAGRSTVYASDLAKGFEIPVVHVNADDPRACLAAVRLALAYRQRFHGDFLIDLVGYRRWGHNEGDEPAYTQPLTTDLIAQHPTVRELWARELARLGQATPQQAEDLLNAATERLQRIRAEVLARDESETPCESDLRPEDEDYGADIDTTFPAERLVELNAALARLPEGFTPEPKLARVLDRRARALEPDGVVDWAHAEALAFASILAEGTPIRLVGQDTSRGTFSQRHDVLHDRRTGRRFTPLQALAQARASFAVYDSPLSESGVLGFEYGYSVEAPGTLVLWEAQYGDFANGAQVIVDQFVVSGRSKWGQTPSLVLLLPHGYEGQGPEHSSARLERFLQLAAADDIRIVYPSTAGQYFHLLRHQAKLLSRAPRPLVVLTPKSLLRNPLVGARLDELAGGAFRRVLDDPRARAEADRVHRLILCSGKLYFDLFASGKQTSEVALVRIEQLYPFPEPELAEVLAGYPGVQEVVWAQEEPRNMGAWNYVAPRLLAMQPAGVTLTYVGRPEMASPSEGSAERHAAEQARIVAAAFAEAAPTWRPVFVGRPEAQAKGLRRGS